MSNLTDRIVLLLRSEAASEALAGVIEEVRDELVAINEACEEAKEQVMDPFSTSSVVAKARKDLDHSTLQATRLEAALERLSDQLEIARRREKDAVKLRRYEEAKAERDALVEDLRTIYPEAAAKIAALLPRIEPIDRKIMAINQDLPHGSSHLQLVEHLARGRPNHQGTYLSQSVRLPALMQEDIAWKSFWPEKQH